MNQIENGGPPRRSQADINRLVEQNIPLAWCAAARVYRHLGEGAVAGDVDLDDLRQTAVIGLIKAATGFDESKGLWASYAYLAALRMAHRQAVQMRRHKFEYVPGKRNRFRRRGQQERRYKTEPPAEDRDADDAVELTMISDRLASAELRPDELAVLWQHMAGHSQLQISAELGRERDYARYRIETAVSKLHADHDRRRREAADARNRATFQRAFDHNLTQTRTPIIRLVAGSEQHSPKGSL